MRRTKEEAEQTRQLILDTALPIFAEKGVSGTSLLEVAKQAKLSRGALYWHFKDKWDIFDALWLRVIGPVAQISAETRAQDAQDPLGGFEQVITMVFKRLTSDTEFRLLIKMSMSENGVISDLKAQQRMREFQQNFQVKRVQTLERAVERGQLRADFDVEGGARFMHAAIDGVILHWMNHPEYYDLEVRAAQFARAIMAGVKGL